MQYAINTVYNLYYDYWDQVTKFWTDYEVEHPFDLLLTLFNVFQMSDPVMLLTLEREARRLASDVDSVVENLACILQSISALTVETVETYR